jgi:capsular exopolysaccharide synthesis family protein
VKSAFDIERILGLRLLGVIPGVRKMTPFEKARVATTRSDSAAAEAFLTLYSNFRLRDPAKPARCILVTSTIPGEGKSFTATNLALTFAAHGENVVVVDCDLRRPILHNHFDLPNQRGLIDLCTGALSIDDAVVSSLHPNLHVITAGGRAQNPSHVLNSPGFERTLAGLRARYDRIVIDTPPIAAVSDALIILPLVDGSLFTVCFDRVRRRAAQYAARRLLESDTPNFGAILNGLTPGISGYYYGQYQDKSYKTYYAASPSNPPTE